MHDLDRVAWLFPRRYLGAWLALLGATASMVPRIACAQAPAPGQNGLSQTLPADADPGTELKTLIDAAVQTALGLMEAYPDSADAITVVAAAYEWLGLTTQSEAHWRLCLEKDPNNVTALIGLAGAKFHLGQDDEVLSLYRRARSLDPQNTSIPIFIGVVLVRLGHFEEAVEILARQARTHPDMADCQLWLGRSYLQLKQYDQARDSYEKARAIDPTLRGVWYGLARTYLRLGQTEEAERCRRQFATLRAQSLDRVEERIQTYDDRPGVVGFVIDVYTSVGEVYGRQGDRVKAESQWRKVIVLDPNEIDCHLKLASFYAERGRDGDALRMYQALARNEPGNPLHPLYAGLMSVRLGRHADAEAAYRRVIELAPNRIEGYEALLGVLLRSGQKPSEAKQLAQLMVKHAPNAHNYSMLAQASQALGDRPAALDALRHAVRLAPENAQYRQRYLDILEGR